MTIQPFKLEEYLACYEFNAPFLLCCSDAQSWSMQAILDLANAAEKKLWDNLHLGYTEAPGHPLLRQHIAKNLYPGLSSEHILCFAGAEDGIFCSLFTLCQPGDHVILLTPCYQSLLEIPKVRGCEVTTISLREEHEWKIDLMAIKTAIKTNTKFLVMNFPHNPTGQVITPSELTELVSLLDQHGIWLFSDEVYRLLGSPREGWAAPAACLYPKAISLGVMSKAFGMAGLRIGWIACQDQQVLKEIERTKHYTSICNSAPAEIISLITLQNQAQILTRNNQIVASNLEQLDHFFMEYADQFSWIRPQGGCVGFVNYKNKESIDDFCARLVSQAGVLLMPASIYDVSSNHFRIGFGRQNMPAALQRFKRFIDE